MDLSVIVPTYGRPEPLMRLLGQLAAQTLPPERYEVIVVDDGSVEPIAPRLQSIAFPRPLSILTQENAGPAAARQTGAAQARGDVLVFLDDDMTVGPGFLEEHARAHARTPRAAVLGQILSPPDVDDRPPFERYHANRLARSFADLAAGRMKLRGQNICSGNLSVRRSAFEEVGGFDTSLPRSEDAELGLRLERAGVSLVYSDAACAAHCSGPESVAGWLAGAFRYGACELRVSEKHGWAAQADPFRYLFLLGPARGALLAASALAPGATRPLPRALVASGEALDRAGFRSAAVHLTGLGYGTQLFRGLGDKLGSAGALARACRTFLAKAARDPEAVPGVSRLLAAAARAAEDFREDVGLRERGEAKYPVPHAPRAAPLVVENIGLQIMLGVRVMRFFGDAGLPLGARVVSRLLRHLYGCDIHWGAQFAPGVIIAHGIALVVADGVRIGPGCILTQNVTIGAGKDSETGGRGVPALEASVHTSPGAIILGPITIGAGSKIAPGAIVTTSMPPQSIAQMPGVQIRKRAPSPERYVEEQGAGSLQ